MHWLSHEIEKRHHEHRRAFKFDARGLVFTTVVILAGTGSIFFGTSLISEQESVRAFLNNTDAAFESQTAQAASALNDVWDGIVNGIRELVQ